MARVTRLLASSALLYLCMIVNARAQVATTDSLVAPPMAMEPGLPPAIDLLHMPSPYNYEHLGFFCKAEVKVNRLLPIPVMFRLGDVQHAEELEGKGVLRGLRTTAND